ncbi:sensor histidine kinase [Croceibacterium aestuarii]|uniref:sensor histidine kinase n=1 Tax=Croceibacterium aestuarii TaxID=3064139 RepID=UPI00272E104A|nr:ATP-binding protein [Croceibacterium sp. D39]
MEAIERFFSVRGLAPHGYCLFWDPALVWTHVVSDVVIALAYFSIPFLLWRLLRIRRDIEFGWLVALFAIFILACGMTHVMGIVTLWVPAYGWEALVKAITAGASLATAALLVPLLPKLVAIPSPAALQAANEALRREAEVREQAEAMLRQSQKMEAIGRLTGGIAHDFNNLLGIVIGNLDRVQRKGELPEDTSRAIDNAVAGAERAAVLIDQLLAFARQQPLQRLPHDVNRIVAGMSELIRQTLGSRIDLAIELEPHLPQAIVDRHQLESALLNLAINARDAMDEQKGGSVEISTRSGDAGMIELAVRDSGCGMDAETLSRAAEPFFTTKPVNEGSGLGLSQVTGTVEQLGGRVEIESAPGTGTVVRLFLPSHPGSAPNA